VGQDFILQPASSRLAAIAQTRYAGEKMSRHPGSSCRISKRASFPMTKDFGALFVGECDIREVGLMLRYHTTCPRILEGSPRSPQADKD
jgi:hypothetical protein